MDATSVTKTNAVLRAKISGHSYNSGFFYGTSKNEVVNLTSGKKGFGVETNYDHTVTCNMNTEAKVTLKSKTTYYYRAFAVGADGKTYTGDVKQFTTP